MDNARQKTTKNCERRSKQKNKLNWIQVKTIQRKNSKEKEKKKKMDQLSRIVD